MKPSPVTGGGASTAKTEPHIPSIFPPHSSILARLIILENAAYRFSSPPSEKGLVRLDVPFYPTTKFTLSFPVPGK